MYNVKGPSKIVAKTTRRGIAQNIDTFRDHSKSKSVDHDENDVINGPKPVFQNVSKKIHNHHRHEEVITPQHAEIIKYINDSWLSCVENDNASSSDGSVSPRSEKSIAYYEDEPCAYLRDFKPFDLEGWWGRRLYNFITTSVNSKS